MTKAESSHLKIAKEVSDQEKELSLIKQSYLQSNASPELKNSDHGKSSINESPQDDNQPEYKREQEDTDKENSGLSKCQLKKIIFQAQDSAFIIGKFEETDSKLSFIGKGLVCNAKTGTSYLLKGHQETHPRYGTQLAIDYCEPLKKSEKDLIVAFLSSKIFPGIGAKTALRIYEELGDEAIDLIGEDPDILKERCNLDQDKVNVIKEGYKQVGDMSSIYMELMKFGLKETEVEAILRRYVDIHAMLEKDCFDPLYKIPSFSYESALKLADGIHLPNNDLRRLSAALYKQLSTLTFNTGSTYVLKEQLFSGYAMIPQDELDAGLNYLIVKNYIVSEKDRLYPGKLYRYEWTIARKLREHSFPIDEIPEEEVNLAIKEVEKELNIQYDEHQKDAIRVFFQSPIMILNGGPGTGKSTTVKGILNLIKKFYPDSRVQLCAPTGKASKRLSELSDRPSRTIHSLLKWNKENNSFDILKEDAEELEFDFIIVDEFSMVDTFVFAGLMRAIPPETRILLIGDEDQLESVGEGKILTDLIESKTIPLVSLTKLYRSSEGGGIAELAKRIRENEDPEFKDGVTFVEADGHQIISEVRSITSDCETPESYQVLAPQYNRGAGINNINKTLQDLLNPFDANKPYINFRDKTMFIEGDRVIQLKNLPDFNVWNGDIGVISEIDSAANTIVVDFDEGPVTYEGLSEIHTNLRHAWAISVHKSQGSEYQDVCVIVDPSHQFMLTKKLIYTAISRAKKKLTIVGNKTAFIRGCRTISRYERQTTLQERLKNVFGIRPM